MTQLYGKQYLMTAGPTPLPPAVSQVMAEPILYHRAPAFVEVYARVLERLKMVFQTRNEVLTFAASGSGAMESAVANLIAPGDVAVVASAGKFGQRWAELCDAYGADTVHLETEWGEKVDPAEVDRALADRGGQAKALFTTQSETSTGVLNDVRALAEVAASHGAISVFDAVSGLGVIDLPTDEWGVDAVVSGSQKALMCPPGLAFAAVSDRALAVAADARARGARNYYFDWERTLKGQRKDPPDSPFTPAVTLIRALDVALRLIEDETLQGVFERHTVLGRAAREAVKAMGLELFGPEDEQANVVTVARTPDGIDGAALPKTMRDKFGITIAGGQGHLKGKIVRIAHCGYYGAFDVLTSIAGLEMALDELGHDVTFGAGTAAAQEVFARAGIRAAQPVG
ncbi:MAG TPA: alanine--glyoxylate aminotransferase family protein [Solirubrobacterales bacterium]|nr:alanine--glyoxylate aminotransferase family protein [Solirubrobacterales bacterium]